MSARLLTPWYFGDLAQEPEKAVSQLGPKLRELEQLVEAMRLSLSYGPVAGAYLPFFFVVDMAPVAAGVHSAYVLPCDVRPIAASAWVNDATSQLTITLDYGSGVFVSIINAWQFTGSDSKTARGDFDVEVIGPAGALVRLEVDSVGDGGTPVPARLAVALWCKNASKIEPA